MKKRDLYLISVIILLAAVCRIAVMFMQKENGDMLRISVDQEIYGEYDLKENQKISIGETNICEIKDGCVRMLKGDCPDQVCVHSTEISKNGQTIICMPNKVVLEIISDTKDAHDLLDIIAE